MFWGLLIRGGLTSCPAGPVLAHLAAEQWQHPSGWGHPFAAHQGSGLCCTTQPTPPPEPSVGHSGSPGPAPQVPVSPVLPPAPVGTGRAVAAPRTASAARFPSPPLINGPIK